MRMGAGLIVCLAAGLLAGCSGKTPDDQVVAKGKTLEVTVPELDQMLRVAGEVPPDQIVATRKAVLDDLIMEKLFAGAAEEQGLDRQPDTMRMMEATKRAVLAGAYVDKVTGSVAAPSDAEIRDYYDAHPELFAKRRAFTVRHVALSGDPALDKPDSALFDKSGMDALLAHRVEGGRDASTAEVQISSADLSRANPAATQKLGMGSQIMFRAGGVEHLGIITAVVDQPVPLANARDMIVALVKLDRRRSSARAEADRLRAADEVKVASARLNARGAARQ